MSYQRLLNTVAQLNYLAETMLRTSTSEDLNITRTCLDQLGHQLFSIARELETALENNQRIFENCLTTKDVTIEHLVDDLNATKDQLREYQAFISIKKGKE